MIKPPTPSAHYMYHVSWAIVAVAILYGVIGLFFVGLMNYPVTTAGISLMLFILDDRNPN